MAKRIDSLKRPAVSATRRSPLSVLRPIIKSYRVPTRVAIHGVWRFPGAGCNLHISTSQQQTAFFNALTRSSPSNSTSRAIRMRAFLETDHPSRQRPGSSIVKRHRDRESDASHQAHIVHLPCLVRPSQPSKCVMAAGPISMGSFLICDRGPCLT